MRIGIIGAGFVGEAYRRLFLRVPGEVVIIDREWVHVYGAWPDGKVTVSEAPDVVTDSRRVRFAVECDMLFLCLPTERKDAKSDVSEPDLTALEWWIEQLGKAKYRGVVVIKSTVPPGFTNEHELGESFDETLRLVHSPEYVGASQYYTPPQYPHPTDLHTHKFVILGGLDEDTEEVAQALLPIMGPGCEFCFCTATESELVKYIVNSWGAMKVTIWGEYYELAKKLELNFANVRTLVLKDRRIDPMHTAVFAGKLGFGNSHCFVKDMAALAHLAEVLGNPMEMVSAAIRKNGIWKRKLKA